MLRNFNEEKIFTDNVNLSEWTQDNYNYPNPALDGIPTNLNDLAEERRQQLHRELDQNLKNQAPPEDESAAPEGDADRESASEESR